MLTRVRCNALQIRDYKQVFWRHWLRRLRLQHRAWIQMYFDYSIQAVITLRYISETWLWHRESNWKHLHSANHVMETLSLTPENVCLCTPCNFSATNTRLCRNEAARNGKYEATKPVNLCESASFPVSLCHFVQNLFLIELSLTFLFLPLTEGYTYSTSKTSQSHYLGRRKVVCHIPAGISQTCHGNRKPSFRNIARLPWQEA